MRDAILPLVTGMLQARAPALPVTAETRLLAVCADRRAMLHFIYEVGDALGWRPLPGFTLTLYMRDPTAAELAEAFAAAAPEAA